MTAEPIPENEFEAEGGELVKELARRLGADFLREHQPVAVIRNAVGRGVHPDWREGPERRWLFRDDDAIYGIYIAWRQGDLTMVADFREDGAIVNPRSASLPGAPELN